MSGGGGGSYNPVQGRLDTAHAAEIDRRNKVAVATNAAATQGVLTPGRKATLMGGVAQGTGEQEALLKALTTNPITEEYQAAADAKKKQEEEARKIALRAISINAGRR